MKKIIAAFDGLNVSESIQIYGIGRRGRVSRWFSAQCGRCFNEGVSLSFIHCAQ